MSHQYTVYPNILQIQSLPKYTTNIKFTQISYKYIVYPNIPQIYSLPKYTTNI